MICGTLLAMLLPVLVGGVDAAQQCAGVAVAAAGSDIAVCLAESCPAGRSRARESVVAGHVARYRPARAPTSWPSTC